MRTIRLTRKRQLRTFSTVPDWLFPVPTHFGCGRVADLPSILGDQACSKPLLVTDKGLGSSGLVKDMMASLQKAGIEPVLFCEVPPNPTDVSICEGGAIFRASGCDSVIALGGGSGLDAGKSIAMTAQTGLSLREVEWTLPPAAVAPGAIPPVITIPTTSGTGAEMDAASMYTDTVDYIKRCVTHPECKVEVLGDPLLTLSLPPNLTAWTGMDALTHAIEAYSVDTFHPMCDGIALEALRLIKEWLPVAFADGSNEEARTMMMAASSMAAVAFQKGLGSVHGLSEPLGAVYNTQHGLTNAVILPYAMPQNRPKIEQKCEILARLLDLPPAPSSFSATSTGFDATLWWVQEMRTKLEIPNTLHEIGVDTSDATDIAQKAAANPTGFTNPVQLSAEDYEALFRAAVDGTSTR